jgi:hypothetical protein
MVCVAYHITHNVLIMPLVRHAVIFLMSPASRELRAARLCCERHSFAASMHSHILRLPLFYCCLICLLCNLR